MRQYLIDLLKCLEAAIPPPASCHHVISFAQYGSDETGWEDKLALQVNRNGVFHCVFLDEGDLPRNPSNAFAMPVELIVANVVLLLDSPTPFQAGIGLGQYLSADMVTHGRN